MNKMKSKRVCLFGGTFNPVHLGHLILANTVLETFEFDKVIFIPSYIQPLKSPQELAPPDDRVIMLKLATRDNPKFTVSDIEIRRKGKSYTIETLRYFKKKFDNLYFVIGADNIKEFHKWKEPDAILEIAKIIVTNRGGLDIKVPSKIRGKKILTCQIPQIEISSSIIREKIQGNKSIKYLVPESVENYIIKKNLYKK